jgi:hypothetical protein
VKCLPMLRLLLYRHREEIGRLARVNVGEDAGTWRLVVCKAGRDGGASWCCAVCKTSQKDDSIKAQVSVCAMTSRFQMKVDKI